MDFDKDGDGIILLLLASSDVTNLLSILPNEDDIKCGLLRLQRIILSILPNQDANKCGLLRL